jgi:transposase
MTRKYRSFSSEFKRELVADIDTGKYTVAEAAREHSISRTLVDRWLRQIHEGTFINRPTPREKQLEKELEKAQAKIGQMTLIIDALKKIQKIPQYTRRLNGSVVTMENLASQLKKDVK